VPAVSSPQAASFHWPFSDAGYTRHVASDHDTLIDALRHTAATLPDVELLVLFGSRAVGSSRADSDVDVAVGLSGRSGEVRRAVEVALSRAVRAPMDVSFLDTAPPQLRFEVARSGLLLFERTEGAWARERARAMVDWWDWAPLARRIHDRAVARLRTGA
jgi:predicted nucleotidyltransferase